jgi:hypothetical protein
MNFLVVFLTVVMDHDYFNYYFVPLVSFWFVVQGSILQNSISAENFGQISIQKSIDKFI